MSPNSIPRRRSALPRALALCVGLGAVAAAGGCAGHVSRAELAAQIEAGDAPTIVDVRSRGEYEESHVPGALHAPFYSIAGRGDEIPTREGQPVVVYCEHGPRAGLARIGLWLAGIGPVVYLEGHMAAWKEEGLPVVAGGQPFAEPAGASGS